MKDFFTSADAMLEVPTTGIVKCIEKPNANDRFYISLRRANELLWKRGQVVTGTVDGLRDHSSGPVFWDSIEDSDPSHTALLINIERIKQETAEDLLREIVDANWRWQDGEALEWFARANKVLSDALKEHQP